MQYETYPMKRTMLSACEQLNTVAASKAEMRDILESAMKLRISANVIRDSGGS